MSKKPKPETLDAQIAVIYDRVEQIHEVLPTVSRHDRELWAGKLGLKILGGVCLVGISYKWPMIAEAFGRVFQ